MKNNNKLKSWMIIGNGVFAMLSVYTSYMYSLRSNNVPWGNADRDGLYMLAYLFFIFPLMLVLSVLKVIVWKQNNYTRVSFVFYALILLGVFFLNNSNVYSQNFITIGIIAGLLTCMGSTVELIVFLIDLRKGR